MAETKEAGAPKPGVILGGAMAYPSAGSAFNKPGLHYNVFQVHDTEAMGLLRKWFPDAKADELNFVLFSTSGVHGSYATIEEAQTEELEDGDRRYVTFLVCMPRVVCMHYGNVCPETDDDWKFLKKLRTSSWKAVQTIGRQEPRR